VRVAQIQAVDDRDQVAAGRQREAGNELGDQRDRLEPQEKDAAGIGLVVVEAAGPGDRLFERDARRVEGKSLDASDLPFAASSGRG